jgi:hypothetical protein
MSAKQLTSKPVRTAEIIAIDMQRAGWKAGCPKHLEETFAIDKRCYAHFSCAGCKSRQTSVLPFHKRGG